MEKKDLERILNSWSAPQGRSNENSWDAIQDKIAAQSDKGRVVRMRRVVAITAVAAAFVAAFLVIGAGGEEVRIGSALAMDTAVQLPDGSSIQLNGGSEAAYDASSWMENREVSLEGEAFFDVEKGSSFQVVTDLGVVEVLGTTFNVENRDGQFEVVCYTGKVRVTAEGRQVELTPGECANLTGNELVKLDSKGEAPDWMLDSYSFEDAPLRDVFMELEFQLGVKFELPDVSEMKFTGDVETNDLQTAVESVCAPLGLEYTVRGDLRVLVKHRK